MVKDDLADVIGIALDELVQHRYELLRFGTLERAAQCVGALLWVTCIQLPGLLALGV